MQLIELSAPAKLGLKVGEWVEVRAVPEILATLDENGRLDELPFMPQMLQYCGHRFRVRSRAHKLCDTANSTGARRMSDAVFLEDLRCDGQAYGGCEMRCLIFWKETWLRRVAPGKIERSGVTVESDVDRRREKVSRCTEEDLRAATRVPPEKSGVAEPVYVCQATQMSHATSSISRWNIAQYIEDYSSGNSRLSSILSGLLFLIYENVSGAGLGVGSALRWMYDRFQSVRGGTPYPSRRGCLPKHGRTPSVHLGVREGEFVRVKEYAEILKTVDEDLKNRGMSFHGEMVPYCGKTFRVLQRAGTIINERTGQLMRLKNECLVLEGADCVGRYTNPLFCPRSCYPYWREIWLERVERPTTQSPNPSPNGNVVNKT